MTLMTEKAEIEEIDPMKLEHMAPAMVIDVKSMTPLSGRIYSLTDTRRVLLILMACFLIDAWLYGSAILAGRQVVSVPHEVTAIVLLLSAFLMFTTYWSFRRSVLIQLDKKNQAELVVVEEDAPGVTETSDLVDGSHEEKAVH